MRAFSILSAACAATVIFSIAVDAKTLNEMFNIPTEDLTPEQQVWLDSQKNLDFQTGSIELPGSYASLELGENYYYLNPVDAAYVLKDLWGNPPADRSLGMVFPAQYLPLDWDAWGMLLNYDALGYVSDEDAAAYDYDKLLKDMKSDTVASNKRREELGYEKVDLIGWAEPPHYDAKTKKLFWAKELSFGSDEANTVNYDIRALGRKGVLVMSVIGSMDQLESIRAAAPDLLAMTNFNAGSKYSDFDPSIDTVAAIGIGGLIAGKVAAKSGLLIAGMLFLKKFWFLLLLPLAALKNKIFGRKSAE